MMTKKTKTIYFWSREEKWIYFHLNHWRAKKTNLFVPKLSKKLTQTKVLVPQPSKEQRKTNAFVPQLLKGRRKINLYGPKLSQERRRTKVFIPQLSKELRKLKAFFNYRWFYIASRDTLIQQWSVQNLWDITCKKRALLYIFNVIILQHQEKFHNILNMLVLYANHKKYQFFI